MLITETKIRIMALFYFVLQSILSFNQNKKKKRDLKVYKIDKCIKLL